MSVYSGWSWMHNSYRSRDLIVDCEKGKDDVEVRKMVVFVNRKRDVKTRHYDVRRLRKE